ncbi:helix-turn-helix domain-containing protein [Zobellella sp. An-6]|uniref:helix-turn-helix domain-containing protein n=1 Tax=Zobellella sp. An-6 TaxID=3400218 RepID=UPI0040438B86
MEVQIQAIRDALLLSQAQMAETMGISQPSVTALEKRCSRRWPCRRPTGTSREPEKEAPIRKFRMVRSGVSTPRRSQQQHIRPRVNPCRH